MFPTAHAEVLAQDWLPPVVLGREAEVAEVVRRLDAPAPKAPPPWSVGVVGPRGSGSSTVARRAAREVADRLRTSGTGTIPRWIAVRTTRVRGTHGVASALLRSLDDGFDGRGFSVPEILAGFLRRLRREARPCVLVLDDVRVGGPDLAPVLRAIGAPDRFLPEGESGIPPVWVVLAGVAESLDRLDRELSGRWALGPFVSLLHYEPHALRRLVEDRAVRALGRDPPADLVERIVQNSVADGGGSTRAIDLLRRALVSPDGRRPGVSAQRAPGETAIAIESSVLRAIEEASLGRTARVGDVRRIETQYARERGLPPLPATTLWRRIVRLEQAGYIRREVRPGGVGGTRSTIRLVAPVDEWVTVPRRPETRRASGAWGGAEWSGLPAPGDAAGGPGLLPAKNDEAG
jgi:hypothetical protein